MRSRVCTILTLQLDVAAKGDFHSGMRTISIRLLALAFTVFIAGAARAQEDPTQQQIDKLSGQIQDLLSVEDLQRKRIDALEKQVRDLQDKLNQPGANNFASADDLKKLADQVQEVDKKRQADNEQILKELEKLDKALNVASSGRHSEPAASSDNTPATSGAQKGYYYEIKSGDTPSAIAKAYRDQLHIKITAEDIMKANPGLDPTKLKIGQKIFIPQP